MTPLCALGEAHRKLTGLRATPGEEQHISQVKSKQPTVPENRAQAGRAESTTAGHTAQTIYTHQPSSIEERMKRS